jgi:hypothetical protein
MDNIVKILVIDTNKSPIHKESYELSDSNPSEIRNTILGALNRLGKGASALIKYKNEYFVADHTAQGKAESQNYFRTKIKYHPYMKELA